MLCRTTYDSSKPQEHLLTNLSASITGLKVYTTKIRLVTANCKSDSPAFLRNLMLARSTISSYCQSTHFRDHQLILVQSTETNTVCHLCSYHHVLYLHKALSLGLSMQADIYKIVITGWLACISCTNTDQPLSDRKHRSDYCNFKQFTLSFQLLKSTKRL